MRKADVLKLREGDVIIYGDAPNSSRSTWAATGKVVRVTPGGQVTVERLNRQDRWRLWDKDAETGPIERVPYHHVWSVERRASAAAPRALRPAPA